MDYERRLGHPSVRIAGVDEVGRGCLAGPVVAAAVVLPPAISYKECPWLKEIRDSKLLGPEQRNELNPLIEGWVLSYGIGVADVDEIDTLNIYHAALLAMRRATDKLNPKPQKLLVDGKAIPKDLFCEAVAVVKGDQKSLAIACSSILAKVFRDRLMQDLEQTYPGYGLGKHKGYPTSFHVGALERLGITPIHRKSFAPVAKFLPWASKPKEASQVSLFESVSHLPIEE